MERFKLKQIGRFVKSGDVMSVKVEPEFIPALQGLQGFGHIVIIWWFDRCCDEASRGVLEMPGPYRHSPAVLGTFATRSPQRPNPLALTVAEAIAIDYEEGAIRIAYADAVDGSPVLDLKPYTPSMDRVEGPRVPAWCRHWPDSLEKSGEFDWEGEFTFG